MKHEDKKHFDVSKPRRHGPDPTSKPIIVGHHPMMPDPMIREEREKATKTIKVISDGDEPELSDMSASHETSPALTPSTPPSEPPEQPAQSPTPESPPGTVVSPTDAALDSAPETINPEPEPEPPVTPTPTAAIHPPSPTAKTPEPATPTEPPAGQELHIPAGHTTVHHKPRTWVWLLVVLIVLIWVYAAVDALTDVSLPYEFFQNLN